MTIPKSIAGKLDEFKSEWLSAETEDALALEFRCSTSTIRRAARALGLPERPKFGSRSRKGTYYGSPCGTCGATLRYVSGRGCVACNRVRSRERAARCRAGTVPCHAPAKPRNPVPGNGWPFSETFENDPRATNAGQYIHNLRKLPFARAA